VGSGAIEVEKVGLVKLCIPQLAQTINTLLIVCLDNSTYPSNLYLYPLPIGEVPSFQRLALPELRISFQAVYMVDMITNSFVLEDNSSNLYLVCYDLVSQLIGKIVHVVKLEELSPYLHGDRDIFTDANNIYIRSYSKNAIYQFYFRENKYLFEKELPLRGCILQKVSYSQKYLNKNAVTFVKCPSSDKVEMFVFDPVKPYQQSLLSKMQTSLQEVDNDIFSNTLRGSKEVEFELFCISFISH
jgi:hypothetical protein